MSSLRPVEAAARESVVSDVDFAAAMAGLGPFETSPHLAVAVSGGGDSMALLRLAARWVGPRGGRLTALTVDHGLRPEAAAEAQQTSAWARRIGVDHHTLTWHGPRLAAGIQAAARAARYDLLEDWCRRAGVLHLLLGHSRDDQAETYLLRLDRKSGGDGLAGMATIVERSDVRLIRPLLAVSRAALRRTLERLGQGWLEDPSNEKDDFARVRVRRRMPSLAATGLTSEALALEAADRGSARQGLEAATTNAQARAVQVYPAGFIFLDLSEFAEMNDEVSRRVLTRCIMTVGGNAYPPRLDRLQRLHLALRQATPKGAAGTLGGCRLLPYRGRLLICRETRGVAAPMPVVPGSRRAWDGRFVVTPSSKLELDGLRVGALGCGGWQEIIAASPNVKRHPLPAQVRPTLPAVFDAGGIVAVPHLDFVREDAPRSVDWRRSLRFRPANSLGGMGFSRVADDALLLN